MQFFVGGLCIFSHTHITIFAVYNEMINEGLNILKLTRTYMNEGERCTSSFTC